MTELSNNNTTATNTANGFLHDSKGNKSSKRLWGSVLLGTGLLFSLVLFIYSLSKGAADGVTALNIINMFLITGGSLLGVGIFETAINKTQAEGKL